MTDSALHVLATTAGLLRDWTDAQGRRRQLGDATLLRLLTALGLPADTTTQRARSLNALRDEQRRPPALWVVDAGRATALPHGFTGDKLTLRDTAGNAHGLALDGACWTPPVQPGYYTLQSGERQLAVAVAPPTARPPTSPAGSAAAPVAPPPTRPAPSTPPRSPPATSRVAASGVCS